VAWKDITPILGVLYLQLIHSPSQEAIDHPHLLRFACDIILQNLGAVSPKRRLAAPAPHFLQLPGRCS
jgi:hypothetical protein